MKRLAMLAAGGLISLLPNIASARSHFFLGFNFNVPLFGGCERPQYYYAPAYSYAPVYTYAPPVYYSAPTYVAPQPTYCAPPVTYYTPAPQTYYAAPQTYYVAPPAAVYQYSGPSVYFHYGDYGRDRYWGHGDYRGGRDYYHYRH